MCLFSGLRLLLFIESTDYPPGISPTKGVGLAIHPFDTMSFPSINGITAPPGFETNIGMKMVRSN